MFLDKLQFGFLLFETPQGRVRVDLSLLQRICLLWTFRNFRQLSIPLLNPRQRALVNALYREGTGVVSRSYDPLLVIGVIEKFVPPFFVAPAPVAPRSVPPTLVPPMPEPATFVPVPARAYAFSADNASVENSSADKPARQPAQEQEQERENARREEVIAQLAETVSKPGPVPSASRRFAWPNLAAALGALSLCIISVMAWHRMQLIPASQANNQPRLQQVNATALANAPYSAKRVEAFGEDAIAIAPPAVTAQPVAPREAAVKSSSIATSIAAVISTPVKLAPPPKTRVHDTSAPKLPLSGQSSGIQASRPPLRFAYPVYPDVRARGIVVLTAHVDSDGAVRAVRIVSGNRELGSAAVRAIRQWRYRPYLKDGQPVATETNIVISFFADDAISMTFPPSIPSVR